jgi:hypothetical protein
MKSEKRLAGKEVRARLTQQFHDSYLAQYGVKPNGDAYRALTNATYQIAFGCDADGLRARLDIGEKENTRDYMDEHQLDMVIWAEDALANMMAGGLPIERALGELWKVRQH